MALRPDDRSENDFDRLMRGRVRHEANSPDFDNNYNEIHWDEVSKFTEVARKGNHTQAKHFVFDPDGQEGSVIRQ